MCPEPADCCLLEEATGFQPECQHDTVDWLLSYMCSIQAILSVIPNMMSEQEASHLDVNTFFWRLLQLPLVYVDHAVLKGQAVYGDAVAPCCCLQTAKRSST